MRRAALLFVLLAASPAMAQMAEHPFTKEQVANQIVNESRAAYYATGHRCACPYDHAIDGSQCGGRSAYIRPGGAEPKCFVTDVKDSDIILWLKQHGSTGGSSTKVKVTATPSHPSVSHPAVLCRAAPASAANESADW
jgi:hypothetical protein